MASSCSPASADGIVGHGVKAALAFEGPGELKFQVEVKLGGLVLLGTAALVVLLSNIVVFAVEFIPSEPRRSLAKFGGLGSAG